MSDDVATKPMYGEELLTKDESNDDAGNVTRKPVSVNDVKRVMIKLEGLKKTLKDVSDKELMDDISKRGVRDAKRDELVRLADLDSKTVVSNLPDIPVGKHVGRGKRFFRSNFSDEEHENFSVAEIKRERMKRMFITAMAKLGGNISASCEKAGITRVTTMRWLKDDPYFREEVMQISEAIVDRVEDALMDRIAKGDTYAITFYLKTRGKHRGYTEKIDINKANDEFDRMSDEELLREHKRLETKITNREGNS